MRINIYVYSLIAFVILLITQLLRLSALERNYCQGCSVARVWRVWEKPILTGSNYTFKMEGKMVACPVQNSACAVMSSADSGDQMRLSGVVQPRVIQGKNRGNVLIIQHISAFQSVKALPGVSIWWYVRSLRHTRQTIAYFYKSSLSQPFADLMAGVVLGSTEVTRGRFYEALLTTGTVHVIAASGFNVTVVAQAMFGVFIRFWRRQLAVGVALGAVGAYVLLTGASASVVRAGLMVGLSLVGQWWGKDYWPVWGLALAAGAMWLIQPWLVLEVSFQLSVAATAGVLVGTRPLLQLVPVRFRHNFMMQNLATTLGATLATTPVILIHFQRLSVISPLANLMLLELVPPLMAVGAVAALVSLVVPDLGQMVIWFARPLLQVFVAITLFLSQVPGASQMVPPVNWWCGWGWWLVLAAWWGWKKEGR